VIEKALSVEDRSVVIDFRVDQREMCFPMVPAGAANDEIITGPEGLRPDSEWAYRLLRSRANSIEGGTTDVMKNIIAERVLGLPRLR